MFSLNHGIDMVTPLLMLQKAHWSGCRLPGGWQQHCQMPMLPMHTGLNCSAPVIMSRRALTLGEVHRRERNQGAQYKPVWRYKTRAITSSASCWEVCCTAEIIISIIFFVTSPWIAIDHFFICLIVVIAVTMIVVIFITAFLMILI